jgi:excisionase family DNA binding protein
MDRPVLTPALLRISEAAQLAGCGRTTAYELAASGEWPTVETPYGRRVVTAGLLKWIEKLQEVER